MTEAEWDLSQDAAAMLQVLRGRSGERKNFGFSLAPVLGPCGRGWSRRNSEGPSKSRNGVPTVWPTGMTYEPRGMTSGACIGETCPGMVTPMPPRMRQSRTSRAMQRSRRSPPSPAMPPRYSARSSATPSVPRPRCQLAEGLPGTARDLAERIYDDRLFEDLPHLADILSVVGCQDGELLAHLRSSGPHFRGCWALDAILGRGEGKAPVTEEAWFSETHPFHMLTWWEYLRGEPSLRKHRLIACASCRLIWPLLADTRLRRAVEVAEEFADGLASTGDLCRAQTALALGLAAGEILGRTRSDMPEWVALRDSWRAAHAAASAADEVFGITGNACHYAAHDAKGRDTEDSGQAKLLREILGNPLRQVAVDPVWLHRNDGAVRKLAQAIYDERAFEKMPLLADALEDAGCFRMRRSEPLSGTRPARSWVLALGSRAWKGLTNGVGPEQLRPALVRVNSP